MSTSSYGYGVESALQLFYSFLLETSKREVVTNNNDTIYSKWEKFDENGKKNKNCTSIVIQ